MRTRVERLVPPFMRKEEPVPEGRQPAPPATLTPAEAARAIQVGVGTIRARIADGTIKAIPLGRTGKRYKIPVSEVEAWLNTPR